MSLLATLRGLYQQRGYAVHGGLDPRWTGDWASAFCWLLRDGEAQTRHLGIAPAEIAFLEAALGGAWAPRRVLVIGNSFGWSTLALALLCRGRGGRVLAVEIGDEPFTAAWIGLTNAMAAEAGLPAQVVQGASPGAVGPAVVTHLDGGPLDLVLIDGDHTPDAVAADLRAIAPLTAGDGVIIAHDAVAFGLAPAIGQAAAAAGRTVTLLWGTPSGMALVHRALPAPVLDAALAFGGGDGAVVRRFRDGALAAQPVGPGRPGN